MVLAVGYDDDGLPHPFVGREALGGQVDGSLDVGALAGHDPGRDGAEEHLGRYVVTRYGQLDERVAGEDYQAGLVILELLNQVGDYPLGLLKTVRHHVIGQHGVGHVQCYDSLYALARDSLLLGAELRTGQQEASHAECGCEEPELELGSGRGCLGHELTEQ